jgi:hypothetical protein
VQTFNEPASVLNVLSIVDACFHSDLKTETPHPDLDMFVAKILCDLKFALPDKNKEEICLKFLLSYD